jgi:riboflavin synthase
MFTGIVQDIGEILAIDKKGDWTLTIAAGKLPLDKMQIGASVACNGICLTIIEIQPQSRLREAQSSRGQFKVQVSAETLSKTTALHWRSGIRVNLEVALHMGDELGGHLISGHIDGIARVKDKRKEGDSVRYLFEIPHEFAKFVAAKGSVALDGISLTVNEVKGASFGVNIIPHTQSQTVLDALDIGGEANFEVDLIARYTERLLNQRIAS